MISEQITKASVITEITYQGQSNTVRVFITIKPVWGPHQLIEMKEISEKIFKLHHDLAVDDKYWFIECNENGIYSQSHHTKFFPAALLHETNSLSSFLRGEIVEFSFQYPNIEQLPLQKIVRIKSPPFLFEKAELDLDGVFQQSLIWAQTEEGDFFEWVIPDSLTFSCLCFKFFYQDNVWEYCPKFLLEDLSSPAYIPDEGTVLHLAPDETYEQWISSLDRWGQSFDSVFVPSLFKSIDPLGYEVSDYFSYSETKGPKECLNRFIKELKKLNKKIILDLPIRFCSSTHEWYQSKKSELFEQGPHGINCWSMNASLPLLNWRNQKVRNSFIQIMLKLIKDFGHVAFRIDCAHEIPKEIYSLFLEEARDLKITEIYGESWGYVDESTMTCNYNFPLILLHNPSTELSKWGTILNSYWFKTGYIHHRICLNYLSSHDTYLFTQLNNEQWVLAYLTTLFLPGQHLYFTKMLEDNPILIELTKFHFIKQETALSPVIYFENQSLIIRRGKYQLRIGEKVQGGFWTSKEFSFGRMILEEI